MHGNHQNWKGNKGVPEGAPLSFHGGCLATPASIVPLLHCAPLAPSALTPSQPFSPNRPAARSPRPASRYIHFTFFSPPLPPRRPSFAYPYSEIPMLSFSPVARSPTLASLAPSPPLSLRPLILSVTLFSVQRCTFEGTSGFYPPPRNCFLCSFSLFPAVPAARERGCSLFLGEHRSLSASFRSFLHLIPPPSLTS